MYMQRTNDMAPVSFMDPSTGIVLAIVMTFTLAAFVSSTMAVFSGQSAARGNFIESIRHQKVIDSFKGKVKVSGKPKISTADLSQTHIK
ncbi:MAG: hypothetical protein QG625_1588 [Cyanobacteriota bacterium erpe_2018_sw_39hr_WHONDRS-SW48-000098_B_bin.30]|jgi:hypothetical protein|nr:hypothetical protein [Cyanobacteriota bacterium erpe_2018_sw_39hr_WHONDRS-SW48-000098_B_bin.30]